MIELLKVGGPWAALVGFLGMIVRAYFTKRSSDREDRASQRGSESGIVETTREAIAIVREQMVTLAVDIAKIKAERDVLETTVVELRRRITELENERDKLQQRLDSLESKESGHEFRRRKG